MQLHEKTTDNARLGFIHIRKVEKKPLTHLTNARTVSEDSAGDGAMTTRASPSNTSSQSI